ncbi:TPA: helix-turn-helix domain-containing protein [Aeromonas salmonicida]
MTVWRTYRGLSQADLAARLGVSLNKLMGIEQSDYPLPRQQLYLLADVLDVQIKHLVD